MKLPVSISFMAVGAAQFAAKSLIRFKPGRTGEAPSWEGRGADMATHEVGAPITDRAYWEGRYALCTLIFRKEDGSELEITDAVAAVNRERRIVCTDLVGCDGTVKEYINEGDWAVNIVVGVQAVRGGVITDDYPDEELRRLREFLDEKKPLEVHSTFLDIFDITKIVIKSYSATQMTEANYQAVSISTVSDEDYEIYSNDY